MKYSKVSKKERERERGILRLNFLVRGGGEGEISEEYNVRILKSNSINSRSKKRPPLFFAEKADALPLAGLLPPGTERNSSSRPDHGRSNKNNLRSSIDQWIWGV